MRSPRRDVAGMLRSLHSAAVSALFALRDQGLATADAERREPWARFWRQRVSDGFVGGYERTILAAGGQGATLLPPAADDRRLLLEAYLLEKALNELRVELVDRPDRVRFPLEAVRQSIGGGDA
jgi:predicted trehalose synthase